MGEPSRKRRNVFGDEESKKKSRTAHFWKRQTAAVIEPGWQGIFATCDKGKEARAVSEMYPILEECASKLYPEFRKEEENAQDEEDEDIELAIKKELSEVNDKKKDDKAFVSVKLDTQCVTFFRVKEPMAATEIVTALCKSARCGEKSIRSKHVHRLTPVARTGRATLEGLSEVAKKVLAPHFHSGQIGLKFAIRPTSRHHSMLRREEVIQTVASCVGPSHTVDLKNYDLLILVELYKNICGISVVKDFEKFKRFNFGQLQIDASQAAEPAAAADDNEGHKAAKQKEEVAEDKAA